MDCQRNVALTSGMTLCVYPQLLRVWNGRPSGVWRPRVWNGQLTILDLSRLDHFRPFYAFTCMMMILDLWILRFWNVGLWVGPWEFGFFGVLEFGFWKFRFGILWLWNFDTLNRVFPVMSFMVAALCICFSLVVVACLSLSFLGPMSPSACSCGWACAGYPSHSAAQNHKIIQKKVSHVARLK